MQEQHQNPATEPQGEVIESTPRQTWQRPTLQRLHVSLDTAFTKGSATDAEATGSME